METLIFLLGAIFGAALYIILWHQPYTDKARATIEELILENRKLQNKINDGYVYGPAKQRLQSQPMCAPPPTAGLFPKHPDNYFKGIDPHKP